MYVQALQDGKVQLSMDVTATVVVLHQLQCAGDAAYAHAQRAGPAAQPHSAGSAAAGASGATQAQSLARTQTQTQTGKRSRDDSEPFSSSSSVAAAAARQGSGEESQASAASAAGAQRAPPSGAAAVGYADEVLRLLVEVDVLQVQYMLAG